MDYINTAQTRGKRVILQTVLIQYIHEKKPCVFSGMRKKLFLETRFNFVPERELLELSSILNVPHTSSTSPSRNIRFLKAIAHVKIRLDFIAEEQNCRRIDYKKYIAQK
jgi:hypothetical protein